MSNPPTPTAPDETVFLTPAAAARRLGVQPDTLKHWDRQGRLPFEVQRTAGGQRRYPMQEIERCAEHLSRYGELPLAPSASAAAANLASLWSQLGRSEDAYAGEVGYWALRTLLHRERESDLPALRADKELVRRIRERPAALGIRMNRMLSSESFEVRGRRNPLIASSRPEGIHDSQQGRLEEVLILVPDADAASVIVGSEAAACLMQVIPDPHTGAFGLGAIQALNQSEATAFGVSVDSSVSLLTQQERWAREDEHKRRVSECGKAWSEATGIRTEHNVMRQGLIVSRWLLGQLAGPGRTDHFCRDTAVIDRVLRMSGGELQELTFVYPNEIGLDVRHSGPVPESVMRQYEEDLAIAKRRSRWQNSWLRSIMRVIGVEFEDLERHVVWPQEPLPPVDRMTATIANPTVARLLTGEDCERCNMVIEVEDDHTYYITSVTAQRSQALASA